MLCGNMTSLYFYDRSEILIEYPLGKCLSQRENFNPIIIRVVNKV
jgi:hypothetical protein